MTSKKILPLMLAGFLMLSAPAFSQTPVVVTPSAASATPAGTQNQASGVSDPVCDPYVFQRMKQKAWAEAQRENYSNQTLIKRPANTNVSVCLDKQLGLAKGAGVAVSGDTTAYENSVQNGAVSIANGNIGPVDSATGKPLMPDSLNTPDGSTTPNTYADYQDTPPAGGSVSCPNLDKLWNQSQCGNLGKNYLPTLATVGTASASGGKDARGGQCTQGTNDVASSDADFTYDQSITNIYSSGAALKNYNAMSTHFCETAPLSQLAAAKCPKNGSNYCWPGKKTGFKLSNNEDEITCSNPGCTPQQDGGSGAYSCKPRS